MSFPIRCFTCNKIIGRYEQRYKDMLESGLTKEETLNTLNILRYCCRRMFLGHVDIVDKLLLFPKEIVKEYESKTETEKI